MQRCVCAQCCRTSAQARNAFTYTSSKLRASRLRDQRSHKDAGLRRCGARQTDRSQSCTGPWAPDVWWLRSSRENYLLSAFLVIPATKVQPWWLARRPCIQQGRTGPAHVPLLVELFGVSIRAPLLPQPWISAAHGPVPESHRSHRLQTSKGIVNHPDMQKPPRIP